MKVPEGLKLVPTPPGVFIGSTEARLDAFSKVCIAETFAPTRASVTRIKAALHEFPEEEKDLLQVDWELHHLMLVNLMEKFLPIDGAARRRVYLMRLISQTQKVREGLMTGRIPRPRHVNPKMMLVRK